MYREFFGLTASPFNNTPDPRFFFNTPDHEEALASLIYAAEERKGFVLVTGEVGAGKTLLSRLLLGRLRPGTKTAVITNTRLRGTELLLAICREFRIDTGGSPTSAELSHLLEQFLLEQHARDRVAVLILDEAQNLPTETFEEIRMLGNLEAENAKLLQILILGQPELQSTFRLPEMRQLHQRVFRTFHLREMPGELTGAYIEHRLLVAGLPEGEEIFEPEAVAAIHEHAEGIPRLVNQICDNAMLAAYTDSRKKIDAKAIREVVEHMLALTVDPEPARPRGAFARQFAGEGSRSSEPSRPDGSPVQSYEPRYDERADARASEMNSGIRQLAARLDATDRKMGDIERLVRTLDPESEETLPDLTRMRENLEAVHVMRRQVANMLEETRTATGETRDQLKEWLEKARISAERVQRNASDTLSTAEAQTEAVRTKTQQLLDEIRAQASVQRERLSELVNANPEQFEAAQRQVNELAEILKNRALEGERKNNETLKLLVDDARATADDTKLRMHELLEQARISAERSKEQAQTALNDTRKLHAGVETQAGELWSEISAHSDEQRHRLDDLLSDHRIRFEAAQKQLDECTTQIKARADVTQGKSDDTLTYLVQQTKTVTDQLETTRDRCEKRCEQIVASMEEFTGGARERVEGGHRQLVEIISAAQFEVQTARQAFEEGKEKLVTDAEIGRSRAEGLVRDTQDLLVKTSEQARSVLADLNARVTEQTQKAERLCSSAISEGAQSLNSLRSELADVRAQADRARSDLEGTVQSATNELENLRTAFTGDLDGYRQDVGKLRDSVATNRGEISRQLEESRVYLSAAGEKYRRGVEELRASAAAIIGDAESSLKSACSDADTSLVAAGSELTAVTQQITAQLDKARHTAGGQITEFLSTIEEGLTRSREQAEHVGSDLTSTMETLQQRSAAIHIQLEADETRMKDAAVEVREGFRKQVTETESSLTRAAEQHKRELEDELATTRRDVEQRVNELTRGMDENITNRGAAAEKITSDLNARMDSMQHQAVELHEQLDAESHQMHEQFKALGEEGRIQIDEAHQRFDSLRRLAEAAIAELGDNASTIRSGLAQDVNAGDERVRNLLERLREEAGHCNDEYAKKIADLRTTIMTEFATKTNEMRERVEAANVRCSKLATELAELNASVGGDLEATRDRLQAKQDEAREAASHLAADMSGLITRATRASEQLQSRVHGILKDTDDRLQSASEESQALYEQFSESTATLQDKAEQAHVAHDAEATRLQQAMNTTVDRNRRALEESEKRIETLATNAGGVVEDLTKKLEVVRQSANAGLGTVSHKLRDHLAEAVKSADKLREEGDTIAIDLARRAGESEDQAATVVARAEAATATLRDQARTSLGDVRGGLIQMNERSELLQRDLARMADEIRGSAGTNIEQLRQTAAGVTSHIESLRDGAKRDADANYRRMTSLRDQVEQGAEQIRLNAGKLLDQVQSGASSIREHANELLSQAQSGSEKIGEQASQLLLQAQSSSERFRQQAENLLHRAENTVDLVRKDMHAMRDDIIRDVDQVRDQASGIKREISEAQSDSAETVRKASQIHEEAQNKTENMMRRAEQVADQARDLLKMPREILDEANRTAEGLSVMSQKVARIVRQLTEATAKAEKNRGAITDANASADEKLSTLKSQTGRVGQLVGVIRQLYGAMDNRVGKLRDKLNQADELCRSVPQEIDELRSALGSTVDARSDRPAAGRAATGQRAIAQPATPAVRRPAPDKAAASVAKQPARVKRAPAATTPAKRPAAIEETADAAKVNDTLAHVAQSNKKLNEWLRQQLGEGATQPPPAAAKTDRANTKQPINKAS